jgi:hypothetical protein
VDATVLLCGLPIFTKRDVGGGYAAIEAGVAGEPTALAIQFAAGSWPERSGSLNRFGVLQEASVESPATGSTFAFAGLITSSKEDDLNAAKQALKDSAESSPVTRARGVCSGGNIQTWIDTIAIPKQRRWMDVVAFLENLPEPPSRETRHSEAAGAMPFLAAMRSAGLSREPSSRRPFVHAGKSYVLEGRWRGPAELEGVIRDSRGTKSAEFRTTYAHADESGLPIRIEYRAKSFLRLVFEADNGAAQPPIRSLFSEEVI